jgi:hypothetical protein
MGRHLFIVSRHHHSLYEYLVERFQDDRNVEVILDRRQRAGDSDGNQRDVERRQRQTADEELTMRSHTVITLGN